MILGMSIGAFTLLHVVITPVAIGSGLIVVGGMFASRVLPVTTALSRVCAARRRDREPTQRSYHISRGSSISRFEFEAQIDDLDDLANSLIAVQLSFHNGGISFSHSRLHAGFGCRNCGLCDPGRRAGCFVQRAPGRRMALDLHSHSYCVALS
jgi:hypothetical protein